MGAVISYTYEIGRKDRIRSSFEKDRGKVLNFRRQYETKIDNQWVAVTRFDTAHIDLYPYGHKDELHPNPAKNRKIDLRDLGVRSLEEGLTYAERDLRENWKKYKKLYLNRLKKL